MKSAFIFMFLSLLCVVRGNDAVFFGGKVKTTAEIEHTILKHARQNRIDFDFDGAPREFRTYTNQSVAIAIYSTHPKDGSFFSGQVEHNGRVSCKWWATLSPRTTNAAATIRGKRKTVVEVERLLLQHAQKQKVAFDFKGADRQFTITTEPPGGMSMSFQHPGQSHCYYSRIDGRGRIWGNVIGTCGGVR